MALAPNVVRLLLGTVLLYFGADWLVRGAAGIARAAGVKPIVVGLTVVAWGTSMPETAVSIASALGDRSAIVVGNVVGSNIANLGLVLGLTAVVFPPRVEGGLLRIELPTLLVTTALLPLLLLRGTVGRIEGALLLLGGVAFTWLLLRSRRSTPAASSDDAPGHQPRAPWLAALVVVGLGCLVGGGKIFVDGAVSLALTLGLSERVVGLTIVAVGTSLPELATSIVAAVRRQSSIAVGNVVGSNVFNVLVVLGVGPLVRPLRVSVSELGVDLGLLAALTLGAAVSLRTERRLERWEGVLLVAGYVVFLVSLGLR